jgi:hypothetical protein
MFQPILILIVLILFGCASCELFSDKNDDCDDTKMEKREEPVIYLKAIIPFNNEIIEVHTPEKVIITGSIRKIYCSGKESGNFSYTPTFFVDDKTFDRYKADFILPQPYQYKFDNTKDKLIVQCHVKVYLEDGLIYESVPIIQEFFYKDIKFDANELKNFIEITPFMLTWFEVTY